MSSNLRGLAREDDEGDLFDDEWVNSEEETPISEIPPSSNVPQQLPEFGQEYIPGRIGDANVAGDSEQIEGDDSHGGVQEVDVVSHEKRIKDVTDVEAVDSKDDYKNEININPQYDVEYNESGKRWCNYTDDDNETLNENISISGSTVALETEDAEKVCFPRHRKGLYSDDPKALAMDALTSQNSTPQEPLDEEDVTTNSGKIKWPHDLFSVDSKASPNRGGGGRRGNTPRRFGGRRGGASNYSERPGLDDARTNGRRRQPQGRVMARYYWEHDDRVGPSTNDNDGDMAAPEGVSEFKTTAELIDEPSRGGRRRRKQYVPRNDNHTHMGNNQNHRTSGGQQRNVDQFDSYRDVHPRRRGTSLRYRGSANNTKNDRSVSSHSDRYSNYGPDNDTNYISKRGGRGSMRGEYIGSQNRESRNMTGNQMYYQTMDDNSRQRGRSVEDQYGSSGITRPRNVDYDREPIQSSKRGGGHQWAEIPSIDCRDQWTPNHQRYQRMDRKRGGERQQRINEQPKGYNTQAQHTRYDETTRVGDFRSMDRGNRGNRRGGDSRFHNDEWTDGGYEVEGARYPSYPQHNTQQYNNYNRQLNNMHDGGGAIPKERMNNRFSQMNF